MKVKETERTASSGASLETDSAASVFPQRSDATEFPTAGTVSTRSAALLPEVLSSAFSIFNFGVSSVSDHRATSFSPNASFLFLLGSTTQLSHFYPGNCTVANGMCSHLCIQYNKELYRCGCPTNFVLQGSGFTCEGIYVTNN